jgi:glycosyltransferase involved in cell wall biosynthesis
MPQPAARPHLLYVAWGFPPCRGSGVYRALATANAFAAGGWDVTVLTVEREVFERFTGADPSLEELVDPSIRVERIPFAWPILETDLRQWSAMRIFAPQVWRRWRTRADLRDFPEISYGPWRHEVERAAKRIHAERRVDLVLGTANPNVAFTAGAHLHDLDGVPYALDYRDAWSLDVFDGARLHAPDSDVGRWEKRLFDSATEVWFVNEPIAEWHRRAYPEAAARIHVVSNGWDPDLAPDHAPVVPPADRPLTFGYIGTISQKVPVSEFLAGWHLARERSAEIARAQVSIRGYLGFYKNPHPHLVDLVTAAEPDGVRYDGPVPKNEVHEVYEQFDVCLLILGTGRYVTSGKVFEYLASGKPVVSVHDTGNAASDVMRGYPLWYPAASLSASDIADALVAAGKAARTADVATREACRAYGDRYRRDLQLAPRVQSLLTASTGDSVSP